MNSNYNVLLLLGVYDNNNRRYLNGNIRELKIWDVPLTDSQIAQL